MGDRAFKMPSHEAIGRIAEIRPDLLNMLVAYFVMEWQEVRMGNPPHGIDQAGAACVVPDYTEYWGTDMCVYYLHRSPECRTRTDPGYLQTWLDREFGEQAENSEDV